MKVSDLKAPYYMYGNKGAMWNNEAHIAKSGTFSGGTLCGTPMLATNHCHLNDVKEIGCKECLKEYENQISKS